MRDFRIAVYRRALIRLDAFRAVARDAESYEDRNQQTPLNFETPFSDRLYFEFQFSLYLSL